MSVEIARTYVELSNRHDLGAIEEMFEADAVYESSRVGSFEGRDAILEMMGGFFRRYPDVRWDATGYRVEPDGRIAFEYVMIATDRETGQRIEGRGREWIGFSPGGRIRSVSVSS